MYIGSRTAQAVLAALVAATTVFAPQRTQGQDPSSRTAEDFNSVLASSLDDERFGSDRLLAQVEEVFDATLVQLRGDLNLTLQSELGLVTLRLSSVCFPERPSLAREFLEDRLEGGPMEVHIEGYDDQSIAIGRVIIGERDIRIELLERGMATYCRRHKAEPKLASAESRAREARVGIWR